jgi:hypothetical protein
MSVETGGNTSRTVDDQLKSLMDYTKFHIGLYTTLCTILIAVIGLNGLREQVPRMLPYFFLSLICFAIAGMFGGLVGSSLPRFTSWAEYQQSKLGPWFLPRIIPAPAVASAEHTAFWLGSLIALWGVLQIY